MDRAGEGQADDGRSPQCLMRETGAVMEKKRSVRSDARGFALLSAFFILLIFVTLGVAAFVYTTLDLRSTTHFKTGNQALAAAESGIVHALHAVERVEVGGGIPGFDVVAEWFDHGFDEVVLDA